MFKKSVLAVVVWAMAAVGAYAQQSEADVYKQFYTIVQKGSTMDWDAFERATMQYSWWQLMELDRRVQVQFVDGTVIELVSLNELRAMGSTIDPSVLQKPHFDTATMRFMITPTGDVVVHKEK